MRRIYSILMLSSLLWAGLTINGRAQVPELALNPEFQHDAQAAVDSLYNFRFEASRKIIEPWQQQYPHNPLWSFWDALEVWWHTLPDLPDTRKDEQLFDKLGRASYQASRVLGRQPHHIDALVVKALSNGLIARQYANREDWLSSLNRARVALSAQNALIDMHLNIPDIELGEGLYHYYAAYLPEKYPIAKSFTWLLPEGDKQKGIGELENAADSSIFVRPEAFYFLGNIYLNHEDEPARAYKYFQHLHKKYPRNTFYCGVLIRSYIQMHRYRPALAEIERILDGWDDSTPFTPVLKEEMLAWKGRALMETGQLDQAQQNLQQSYELGKDLPNTSNRPMHVMAGYYLGQISFQSGRMKEAEDFLKPVARADVEGDFPNRADALLKKINR